MKLIGLNGRLHSGKDTVCEIIESLVDDPSGVHRIAFADKLKLSAALALGFDPVDTDEAVAICNNLKENGTITVWDEEKQKSHQIDGRYYLQLYGTEAHRNVFDDQFWVNALLPMPAEAPPDYDLMPWANELVLKEHFPGSNIVVVTDVRFPNEAQRIRELDGDIWYIDAEKRLGPLPKDAHPSECPLPDDLITWVLDNNGSLSELREAIIYGLEEVMAV